MRLLYFAPHQIWPVNTGARLRDYQLARQLAARSSLTFVEMRHAGQEPHIPPDDSGLAASSHWIRAARIPHPKSCVAWQALRQ